MRQLHGLRQFLSDRLRCLHLARRHVADVLHDGDSPHRSDRRRVQRVRSHGVPFLRSSRRRRAYRDE